MEAFVTAMSNKTKRNIIMGLALTITLASCGKVEAKPNNYDELLADDLTNTINDTLASIYDAYMKGDSSNSNLVDELLFSIAEQQFGVYDELEDGNDFKEKVDKRALEKLYNKVSTSVYEVANGLNKGNFDEHKFALKGVYNAGYYVVDASGNRLEVNELDTLDFYTTGRFLPRINKDNFTDPANELIHLDYYKDYLKDAFHKEIYRELLVEDYLLTEQGATLGRNYARKVKYVAINENKRYPDAVRRLFNTFIDENILGPNDSDLEILASAWRGISDQFFANELDLLTKANLVLKEDDPLTPDVDEGEYETLYGEVLTDFNKIKDDLKTTDKEIENDFTKNGTQSAELGFKNKVNDVAKTDLTKDEWAIKNGGLSTLPETIRSRIFNIGTSNGVDLVLDDKGVLADAGKMPEDVSATANTFVRNINGKYYLVPKEYEKNDNRNFLFFENGVYYIFQIEEAVNTSKLTEGNAREYTKLGKTEEQITEIKDEIVRKLGELDTNRTATIQYFIEKANLTFHDEKIQKYFQDKYPEIFKKK
jgi:hypothetical protein